MTMTHTEKLVEEINNLFKLTGDEELAIPKLEPELELVRAIKVEYKRRLLEKVPQFKVLSSEALIPDMFLQSLRKRELELQNDRTI
jgi:hypothetical protein